MVITPAARVWVVYGASVGGLMALFGLFAGVIGWPPGADSCVPTDLTKFASENTCYCESFDPNLTKEFWRGVHQPVNTWSNLYALLSGAYLAWWMWKDRKLGGATNVMKSKWWMGDVYLFCIIFLGLGSMWLHASMSKWVSWFDNFSMYVFTGFLVFYTLDRWLIKLGKSVDVRTRYFWIGYPLTAAGFTLIGALTGLPSEILIGTLVAVYLWLEHQAGFIWDGAPKWFWLAGLASFGAAAAFRSLSQTGGPMCWPDSAFQPHGLLWHTLSGLMALFIYFYWRRDKGGLGTLPSGYQ